MLVCELRDTQCWKSRGIYVCLGIMRRDSDS